jgi:hypothetical protein
MTDRPIAIYLYALERWLELWALGHSPPKVPPVANAQTASPRIINIIGSNISESLGFIDSQPSAQAPAPERQKSPAEANAPAVAAAPLQEMQRESEPGSNADPPSPNPPAAAIVTLESPEKAAAPTGATTVGEGAEQGETAARQSYSDRIADKLVELHDAGEDIRAPPHVGKFCMRVKALMGFEFNIRTFQRGRKIALDRIADRK